MGGDGGSFASRTEMVKTKGWGFTNKGCGGMGANANHVSQMGLEDHVSLKEQRRIRTSLCRLSQEPLREPVVVCRLGSLYNKEVLLSRLLAKELPPFAKHIKSLRDVKNVSVSFVSSSSSGEERHLVCPMTTKTLDDGVHLSAALWTCGCLLSTKAFDESSAKGKCPKCDAPFTTEDKIPIFPSEEQFEKLVERVEVIRAAEKEKAEQKKAGKRKVDGDKPKSSKAGSVNSDVSKQKKQKTESAVLNSLFHKGGGSGRDTAKDAFGQGFSGMR